MRSILSGLSADPSRDPHKFGKWRKRAVRFERELLRGDLNGETENVTRMLADTVERLRQLGGVIPSVPRAQTRAGDTAAPAAPEPETWEMRNEDGVYEFYSAAGTRRERKNGHARSMLPGLRPDAAVEAIAGDILAALRDAWDRLEEEDRIMDRADRLWEGERTQTDPAPAVRPPAAPFVPGAVIRLEYEGNFSPDKDPARYALDQLGFE